MEATEAIRAMEALEARARGLEAQVRAFVSAPPSIPRLPAGASVVTTGIGGSSAPARYLAWLLRETLGIDARFEPLSRFAGGAPRADALVVFSQYLSPNARLALRAAGRYAWASVFTSSATLPSDVPTCIHPVVIPPERESGTLVRIVGPTVASCAGALAAASWGAGLGVEVGALAEAYAGCWPAVDALDHDALAAAASGALPTLVVTASVDVGIARGIAWKLMEGWSVREPVTYDVLEIAHGPFQAALAERHLVVTLEAGDDAERDLFDRLETMLAARGHHRLRLRAPTPRTVSPLALDGASTALLLAGLRAAPRDVSFRPSGADAPLYGLGG